MASASSVPAPNLPDFVQSVYAFVAFFNGDTEQSEPPACGTSPYLGPTVLMVLVLWGSLVQVLMFAVPSLLRKLKAPTHAEPQPPGVWG